jgi:hypothetical protein
MASVGNPAVVVPPPRARLCCRWCLRCVFLLVGVLLAYAMAWVSVRTTWHPDPRVVFLGHISSDAASVFVRAPPGVLEVRLIVFDAPPTVFSDWMAVPADRLVTLRVEGLLADTLCASAHSRQSMGFEASIACGTDAVTVMDLVPLRSICG